MSKYNVIIPDRVIKELNKINRELRIIFFKNIKKLEEHIPGKHLEHSNYFIEKVTESTRIACEVDYNTNTIKIIHCFKTHKEYEDWYKSL